MLAYKSLSANRVTFAIATVLMLFCMGGNFAMFPAQTMRAYGADGASVYSFMFTGFGLAALMGPIASNALLGRGGFELVYKVLGTLSFVAFALTLTILPD